MADTTVDTSTQDGNNTGETTSDAGDEFKAITSQDDLNRIIADRIGRERAKFADYKDVKTKAAEYDKVVEAGKTEAQRQSDATAAALRERDAARTEALKLRIATKHGVSDEDADLFLTGADEQTLTRQAQRLADREADRKKQGNHVAREGTTSITVDGADAAFARGLLGGGS